MPIDIHKWCDVFFASLWASWKLLEMERRRLRLAFSVAVAWTCGGGIRGFAALRVRPTPRRGHLYWLLGVLGDCFVRIRMSRISNYDSFVRIDLTRFTQDFDLWFCLFVIIWWLLIYL